MQTLFVVNLTLIILMLLIRTLLLFPLKIWKFLTGQDAPSLLHDRLADKIILFMTIVATFVFCVLGVETPDLGCFVGVAGVLQTALGNVSGFY